MELIKIKNIKGVLWIKQGTSFNFYEKSILNHVIILKYENLKITGVKMLYFRYKNMNIYYEEKGNGNIPLVFLHGNTARDTIRKDAFI